MSDSAGWYPQPDGRQRYWDGQEWTTAWAPGNGTVPIPEPTMLSTPEGSGDAKPVHNGPPRSKNSKRMALAVAAALVVIGSATGLALKVSHDNQVTAQRVATAQAERRATDAAQAKVDADAAAAKAAADVKQAADDLTRAERKTAVGELETAILKDAKARVKSATLTGPILSASCTPLGGGSADDLTSLTGTFECIAVNKKNADGSSSGYRFSAAINWGKDYTWHLGS